MYSINVVLMNGHFFRKVDVIKGQGLQITGCVILSNHSCKGIGGLRGTVILALALSLSLTPDYWDTIYSVAYGVVLFDLFVQSTTMDPLIRKLDIT